MATPKPNLKINLMNIVSFNKKVTTTPIFTLRKLITFESFMMNKFRDDQKMEEKLNYHFRQRSKYMYKLCEEYRKIVSKELSYAMRKFVYKKTNELITYGQIALEKRKSDEDQAFVLFKYRIPDLK